MHMLHIGLHSCKEQYVQVIGLAYAIAGVQYLGWVLQRYFYNCMIEHVLINIVKTLFACKTSPVMSDHVWETWVFSYFTNN